MANHRNDLGTLVSSHGTSPVYLQRAAIIAVLSFFFFMTMLVVFYARQQIVYFILSTAFLIVYVFTMVGWVMQKRNVVSIYENGVSYKKFASTWDEIASVNADSRTGITITKSGGETVTIGGSVAGVDRIAALIRRHLTS